MGSQKSRIQAYGEVVRNERKQEVDKWRKQMEKRKEDMNISSEKEELITKSSASELVELLNKGLVTSRQIVTILAWRCVSIGFEYNYITQLDFDVADRAAQQCDDERIKSGKKNWTFQDEWNSETFLPPLFGIPTSVKDMFDQKGKRSTLGVTTRAHDIKEKDCGIISCLREGGLIPFVRSNVAQTTMTWETDNFLFGRSINVWNPERSVGGSSGGEGGLLSSFCSPIGIGSDIGGSLRIPAQFNGIASLRPCFQRFSTSREYSTNMPNLMYGNDSVISVFGPLARSVEDLALWMKTTCDEKFHLSPDPFHRLIQFDTQTFKNHSKKHLKIGIIKSFSGSEASHASQRAVGQVASFLQSQGHETCPVEIPFLNQIMQEFSIWYLADGNFKQIQQFLGGEKEQPVFRMTKYLAKYSSLRWLASCATKWMAPRLHASIPHLKGVSTTEYFEHKARVAQLRMGFCKWWKQQNLDHIILPGFGCQAYIKGEEDLMIGALSYTSLWNLLNMPTGALPVSVVREEEQHYESIYQDMSTRSLARCARGSKGLPVGIQVIGLPFEEEKVLSLMKVIEVKFLFDKNRKVPIVKEKQ